MPEFKAPLRDMRFVFEELLNSYEHYQNFEKGKEATPDMVNAIMEECAKFCEQELAPLYQTGDEEGCRLEDGHVTTPSGFKEAYQTYVESGWQGINHDPEYGGLGLPISLGVLKSELISTANWSWGMYPGLSIGAMNTIFLHGDESQKQTYLTKLIEGSWTGTMCLTEPQCGTDLGQVKTKAELNADGSYTLTGTKIFISAGEHDMAENIVHIVLARLPDAPKGTRGISLFIVPKFLPDEQGNVGERNGVVCSGLEKKMGIKASSTCVMSFDQAKGYLIGPPNKGLQCMFTFMNTARIGTGLQGSSAAERSFQGALAYAKERCSMRSLSGKKAPDKVADPIIFHPDVRRMLLTQKAIAEGGRAMIYYAANIADYYVDGATDEVREKADDDLGFLTPILKAFLTETGYEAANLGMQVFGGHGYIKEWGMEQIVRDTRIATLYEGTTGIQALDLLGRKILLDRGGAFRRFSKEVKNYCAGRSPYVSGKHRSEIKPLIKKLKHMNGEWTRLTMRVVYRSIKNRDEIGASSVDYLMYSGYVVMAYFWAMMAEKAAEQLAKGAPEVEFYRGKIETAKFYFDKILPRTCGHRESILSGSDSLMGISQEAFAVS
ncbi:acyl-CoA dehydrogenase C-terminal domain-containing protein [Litoribrevibacter albus]|uniref:3-methylmercaptopropionyl-CoA dehydrogenase n=1 Tax=Litoribrevibacter albus TaxID=1473156 RepID=A0AA37SDM5_9GAMM|nr:acyl-CoA dehydrogenase C-terminal domain-containing protein [Litoribrevibacter albus]GLQ33095.1 acyl-CoA dehydrogenase [Litoribrevibacter albus]